MSHTFRFLGELRPDQTWCLAGEEAHHFAKVLRLEVGTNVEVTDGRGDWGSGQVLSASAKEVVISAAQVQRQDQPRVLVEIAVGALKPGFVDEILPMLCELGVDRVHVFGQVGVSKARLGQKVHDRWQRIVAQSVKQCKRAWLPQVLEHDSVADLVRATTGDEGVRVFLRAGTDAPLTSTITRISSGRILAVIGGEKGFDPSEELALIAAGFVPASLTQWILRAVTAAVAAAAALSLHRDQL
jgi:16S rRNA (uracil1498-N3)-methyltransferase